VGNSSQNDHWSFRITGEIFNNLAIILKLFWPDKNRLVVFLNIFLRKNTHFPIANLEGNCSENGKIPFASATEVNCEPHSWTQCDLSANSHMGGSHQAWSSIKMPDLLMQKWHWSQHAQLLLLSRFLSWIRAIYRTSFSAKRSIATSFGGKLSWNSKSLTTSWRKNAAWSATWWLWHMLGINCHLSSSPQKIQILHIFQ